MSYFENESCRWAIPRLFKAGAKREPGRAKHEEMLRHQENAAKPQKPPQTGWLSSSKNLLPEVINHPVRSNTEASRHFLTVASTPPWKGGESLAPSSSRKSAFALMLIAFLALAPPALLAQQETEKPKT